MSFQLLCLTFQMLSLSRMSVRSGRLVFYTYNLLCLTSRVFAEGVHGALNEAALKTVTPTAGPAISRVTEAPGAELVHQQLAKKALNLCTQWSVVGYADVGCSTGTCLFATQNGRGYEFCGIPSASNSYFTNCYNYPIQAVGNPPDVAYCPASLPYCGTYQFSFQGATFYNFGCATLPYNYLVVTKPGATFPGSTTTTAPKSTTTTTTSITTTSSSSSRGPNSSTIVSSKSTSTTSSDVTVPSTSLVPCSDPIWDPTPENWYLANVDEELAKWWASTTSQRGSATFVDWLSRSFGDMSRGQQCGIGRDSSCSAPDCQAFKAAGGPRWVYFVRISLVNMNTMFNIMKEGMQDAESDLSLVIQNMANDFFPWVDPRSDLEKALPWIQAFATIALSFIPIIGPALSTTSASFDKWAPKVVDATKGLVDGGVQALTIGQSGGSPLAHQIGTVMELGALIKQVLSSMRVGLGDWSKSLFDGSADASGKTIIDYMAGGRFTLNVGVSVDFLDAAYYKIQISKLVNDQWKDRNKPPSRTFVMCTNSTSATCNDASRYTESGRTCCLYSLNGDGKYVTAPSLAKLASPTYNVSAADITASSLHSYLAGGLMYDDSRINDRIRATISLNSSESFLAQGVRFQGVWTLPVCDVGSNAGWVANAADGQMPCCCGVKCGETEAAWAAIGIPRTGSAQQKCKTQCPTCGIGSTASALDIQTNMWIVVIISMLGFCLI